LSCSGEDQAGYDVKFDVIPPTPTNGQDPLPAVSAQIALSETNPSYTLGGNDTSGWTGMLNAEEQQRRDGGQPGFVMSMEDFSFEADGTVDFFVRVLSRIGRITGRPLGYTPVSPPSCSFTLEPAGATGQDYADNVNQCLSDWILENGVPVEFDMEVTSAAAGGSLPKSGFATKATSSFYLFSGRWELESNNPCDWGFSDEVLDAIIEGDDFFGVLECDTLALSGQGRVDAPIDYIAGGADIWDACGNYLSHATLERTPLSPGNYQVVASGTEGDVTVTQTVPVTFKDNDAEAFTEALLSAAAGNCENDETPPQGAEGYAFVGWVHCGAVPRSGEIRVVAAGFCPLAD